jgi:hypothetical protein
LRLNSRFEGQAEYSVVMLARLRIPRRRPINPGLAAIAGLVVAWALLMHALGWGQLAHYAQVRALSDGQSRIDRWHWETKDKAWIDGHFYSVKAPGLAFLTLPAYLGLEAAGAQGLADDAASNARAADTRHWIPINDWPYAEHGYRASRAARVTERVETGTPMVWSLGLVGALIPAAVLLGLVRSLGDRIEPGFGTAAAITLGLCTVVMTFASEYFPHVIAATLGFGAFAVLFRERRAPPRTELVSVAGLLAGLGVTFEYPLALVGAILFVYALARRAPRLPRAAAYALGAFLGALPVLLFNQWAFGSPLQFAYGDAVAVQGLHGHTQLGLNDDGFFGISVPEPGNALDLLIASRGLLTLTPVLAIAVAGAVLMRRRGFRAESTVILAITAAYFVYNAGYWLPFGGGTPGPRFLVPTLPFLALGLAVAWRRWPALTLGLAIPSAIFMVAASITLPLIGELGTWIWAERLSDGDLEHTLLTALGVHESWIGMALVLIAIVIAVTLAIAATPRTSVGEIRTALAAVAGWAAISTLGPALAGDPVTPISGGGQETLALIGAGTLSAFATLLVLRYRELRSGRAVRPAVVPAPAPAD